MSTETALDLNFANVEAAEGGEGKYLRPGIYFVKPTEVELVKKDGSTPFLRVIFTAINGDYEGCTVDERFFLSAKALPRLQYLHEKYLGFKLEKNFPAFEQLAEYFKNKLTVKAKTIAIAVAGQEKDGKVYGGLPYTNFIIEDTATVEEGAYPEDSEAYRKSIRKVSNASTNSNSAVLSGGAAVGTNKLPWED